VTVRSDAAEELRDRLLARHALHRTVRRSPVADRRARSRIGARMLDESEGQRPAACGTDRADAVAGDRKRIVAVTVEGVTNARRVRQAHGFGARVAVCVDHHRRDDAQRLRPGARRRRRRTGKHQHEDRQERRAPHCLDRMTRGVPKISVKPLDLSSRDRASGQAARESGPRASRRHARGASRRSSS